MASSRLIDALQSTRLAPIAKAAQAFQSTVHRHPRRMSAAVLTLLAGSALTAFGVAPLTSLPEGPTPTITLLTESIEPAALPEQLQGLGLQTLRLYRSEVTRSADTADSLLKRLGVDDVQAAQFVRNDAVASSILQGRVGKSVKAVVEDGQLVELVVRGPADTSADIDIHFTKIVITRLDHGGYSVQRAVLPLERTPQMASATIQSSLFAAADDAHIPDAVTNQIAEIFGNEIDFRRELRKGDAFSVLYEAHLAEGEPVTWGNQAGRVLAARFINKGDVHDAVWHQEPNRKGAYFDLTGRSKVRAFLSSPLAFSRVTSGFAMRFHPIHKTWRAHLGVDFGAPTGTPVRTVGEGVVSFSGWQNGYGNVVQVQHSGNRSTVYAHLSRIDVRRGQRVEQGERIGAVGATGWATGPHLHFEFKVGGQQVDPMTIARASESLQLSAQSLAQFRQKAVDVAERLKMASEWQAAGAESGPRFE